MDITITDYVDRLSSPAPVPGGGGVCALLGAVGFSLGAMVANLTKAQSANSQVIGDMDTILEKLDIVIHKLLFFMEKDEEVFIPLSKAYHMSLDAPHKEIILEKALVLACSVPFEILEVLTEAIGIFEEIYEKGIPLALSDVGIGISGCKSSFEAAILNIYINTKPMKDRNYANKVNLEAKKMYDTGVKKCQNLYDIILAELCFTS